jgi:hypothetical protein
VDHGLEDDASVGFYTVATAVAESGNRKGLSDVHSPPLQSTRKRYTGPHRLTRHPDLPKVGAGREFARASGRCLALAIHRESTRGSEARLTGIRRLAEAYPSAADLCLNRQLSDVRFTSDCWVLVPVRHWATSGLTNLAAVGDAQARNAAFHSWRPILADQSRARRAAPRGSGSR